eukprot:scpid92799/ scgid9775/ 
MAEASTDTSIITILISNTNARVKLNRQLRQPFSTNIGVVQGDPLSPLMYIMYAEGAMRKIDEQCPRNSALPCPFSQYADDTTVHAANANSTTCQLSSTRANPFSLKITSASMSIKLSISERQKITTTGNASNSLGQDLEQQKMHHRELAQPANRAFSSIAWKRHSPVSRFCMFSCLITPILFNCALWTLSKALPSKLDIWHRKKLNFLMNIHHPHQISNNHLYSQTNSIPITSICRERRLLWFGHVVRHRPNSPSYQTLMLATDTKKPSGPPP